MLKNYEKMALPRLVFGVTLLGLEIVTVDVEKPNQYEQACWVKVNLWNRGL